MMPPVVGETELSFGSVKFYSRARGFGFIVGDDGIERFFNENQLRSSKATTGNRVMFVARENANGPVACRVEVLP